MQEFFLRALEHFGLSPTVDPSTLPAKGRRDYEWAQSYAKAQSERLARERELMEEPAPPEEFYAALDDL